MNEVLLSLAILGLPGGGEWIIIAIVILILFGGRKIPELMRGLGSGIKEFKRGVKDDNKDEKANENNWKPSALIRFEKLLIFKGNTKRYF